MRKIAGTDVPDEDLNLDNSWWVIYGLGMNQNAGSLMGHTPDNQWVTASRLNIVSDGATIACSLPLFITLFTAIAVFANKE